MYSGCSPEKGGIMKISFAKLKVAAVDFMPEFMEFSAKYKKYCVALNNKVLHQNCTTGNIHSESAETDTPPTLVQQNYVNSVHGAINKLIKLDRKFFNKYNEHIFVKLETFADFENVLGDISELVK